MTADQGPDLNTEVRHSARVWNYWLGGKDNFAADRAVGDQVRELYPDVVKIAQASRALDADVRNPEAILEAAERNPR